MTNLDKETKKLRYLQFQYNIARLSNQDIKNIKKLRKKYWEQSNIVLELKKTLSNKRKEQISVTLLEDLF